MKKKILPVVILVIVGIIWFVLANKFEDKIHSTYLPVLQEKKDSGLIELAMDDIKIHKYKFTVIVENIAIFPKSDFFQAKLDKISVFYNPFTSKLSFCAKKLSVGTGETEVFIENPSFAFNKKDDKDIFHITWNIDGATVLRAIDNSILVSDHGSFYEIMGKLDEKTNQYLLTVKTNTKGAKATIGFFNWSNLLAEKMFQLPDVSLSQKDKKFKDFVRDLSNNYNLTFWGGSIVETNANLVVNADKKHLENMYSFIQGNISIAELTSKLVENFDINKELFDLKLDTSYNNNLINNKVSISLSGDSKEVKANIDVADVKNYTKDQALEITKLVSEFLAEAFNKYHVENDLKIKEFVAADFANLADSVVGLKNINLSANLSYKIQESEIHTDLHFGVNEYDMNLSIDSKNPESYTGIFTLSDPDKLIKVNTKFANEVVLPLVAQMVSDDNSVVMMKKLVSNVENNGFDALKVFSKNQNLEAGDKMETDFIFELKNLNLKINDKSFLDLITNSNILKFLGGFNTELTQEELQTAVNELPNEIPQEESVPEEQIVDKVHDDDINGSK